jgi:hypothetical protein
MVLAKIKDGTINNTEELSDYYQLLFDQPFREQILFDNNFIAGEILDFYSNIIGTEIKVSLNNVKDVFFCTMS